MAVEECGLNPLNPLLYYISALAHLRCSPFHTPHLPSVWTCLALARFRTGLQRAMPCSSRQRRDVRTDTPNDK